MNSRRQFLQESTAIALGFSGLQTLSARLTDKEALRTEGSVSYTHLTLPTIYSV